MPEREYLDNSIVDERCVVEVVLNSAEQDASETSDPSMGHRFTGVRELFDQRKRRLEVFGEQ